MLTYRPLPFSTSFPTVIAISTVSLAEKDIILETLRNKYDLAIAEPITLDQMKLIYYPMTTGRNETGHWMCDMIPAWQFRFIEDEIEQYVYINALDGREIAG